jgi:hypothetical protein
LPYLRLIPFSDRASGNAGAVHIDEAERDETTGTGTCYALVLCKLTLVLDSIIDVDSDVSVPGTPFTHPAAPSFCPNFCPHCETCAETGHVLISRDEARELALRTSELADSIRALSIKVNWLICSPGNIAPAQRKSKDVEISLAPSDNVAPLVYNNVGTMESMDICSAAPDHAANAPVTEGVAEGSTPVTYHVKPPADERWYWVCRGRETGVFQGW